MSRVTCPPTDVTGKWPSALVALTQTAADATNKNQLVLTGREIVIARNIDAGSTRTITVTSVADPLDNRTGNITTQNIAAGALMMIGPLAPEGWRQTDGYLYIEASHADVKFSVVRIPG